MAIAIPANSKPQRNSLTPDINVTPLVDVVLVLLIIFMVIAPTLEVGERVELPGILSAESPPATQADPITITLAQGGGVFFEKEPLSLEACQRRLGDEHAVHPDRKVVIKADGAIAYERVRGLFESVRELGYSGVSLMVSKRSVAENDRSPEQKSQD